MDEQADIKTKFVLKQPLNYGMEGENRGLQHDSAMSHTFVVSARVVARLFYRRLLY